MSDTTIQFTSKGTISEGDLYLPPDFDPDGSYTTRKIAPRAYCIVQLTGHDVYHPDEPIQIAFREAGEPKRMASLKMDQLDCYKSGYREQAIGAATAFFHEYPA